MNNCRDHKGNFSYSSTWEKISVELKALSMALISSSLEEY